MRKNWSLISSPASACGCPDVYASTAALLPAHEDAPWVIPQAHPPDGMRLRAFMAGKLFSRAALAYAGGAFTDRRVFNMGAILVEHPKGLLLFDTGLGTRVDQHIKTAPKLMQMTTRYEQETTVARQLVAAGIDKGDLLGVVLTHAHWDHVSGLDDLPDVPVWLNQTEWDFVTSGHRSTALARQLIQTDRHMYAFDSGPYLGFASSHDVFGDGSVVLVWAPGHTPGSIIVFINLPGDMRYALLGDLVWQIEGLTLPAEKPWFVRRTADQDATSVKAVIGHMRHVQQRIPSMHMVPAHDRRIWEDLASTWGSD